MISSTSLPCSIQVFGMDCLVQTPSTRERAALKTPLNHGGWSS